MKYDDVKMAIISVICKKLQISEDDVELYLKFYLGKTANYKERKLEHFNGEEFGAAAMPDSKWYNKMYTLAIGSSSDISKLEKELIQFFKDSTKYAEKCANELEGSSGNADADTLYVLFHMEIAKTESAQDLAIYTIHDDDEPIDDGFPFTIE